MSLYGGKAAQGICDRCHRRFDIRYLTPDPNNRSLMVCKEDLDELDPYMLRPRADEDDSLPFIRKDVTL